MVNTLKYVNDLNGINAKINELDKLLNGGELGFKLEEVLGSYASLFNRFCPYKVGDRVQLIEDLDIPEGHGWYCAKHFLIKGAIATVKDVGYRDDLFSFGLEFDNESWVHYKTCEIIPIKEGKHLFYFAENKIEKCCDDSP
ncbi:MAG: hypothetical protein IM566_04160 [Pseudanabaena sp. M152S2SP2A07QC]|jgi:hypothetical protein|nr:hypothetical protein [Pseudanabaena sp. M109S1SP2A07QC]MCA6546617.1 hypothetical protein [Pseudanabaena sp. M152S2SP2A07QC]